MLVGGAAEVQRERVGRDGRGEAQLEVALARLEQVGRGARAVGQRVEAGTGAALGVVQHGGGGLAQALDAEAPGELAEAVDAGPVGGELRPQVGAALVGLAHPPAELGDRRGVEHPRGDDHALLVQRRRVGRHRARHPRADVGVVGARGREAQQLAGVGERGRHDRDVGQVRAACVGVVEDPAHVRRVLLAEHGGDRRGHRAEVHGDVLGLHDHLAGGVEEGGRAVAALLDVRAVGRAHERGAHLLAGGAQRAGGDLQGDRVHGAHASRSRTTVPVASVRDDHPGAASAGASAASPARSTSAPGRRPVTRTVTTSTAPSGSRWP